MRITGNKRTILTLLIISFIVFLFAVIAESVYLGDFEYRYRTKKFNRVLASGEGIMEYCLNALKQSGGKGESFSSATWDDVFSLAEKNNITILEYLDDKLVYWSDNHFDVPLTYNDSIFSGKLVFLQNGWFITETSVAGNEKYVGLLRIRTEYAFENDIIKSGFVSDFRVNDDVGFKTSEDGAEYIVTNRKGDFLFSLDFPEEKSFSFLMIIPLVLWISFLVLLIFLDFLFVRFLADKGKHVAGLLFSILIFSAFYGIVLISGKPEILMKTDLFSPYISSINSLVPSLGHLLLISVFAAVTAYTYLVCCPSRIVLKESHSRYLFMSLMLILAAVMMSIVQLVFMHLVTDTNISFETYKVLDLGFFSVAAYTSVLLLLYVPVIFLIKTIRITGTDNYKNLLIPVLTSLAVFPVFFVRDLLPLFSSVILYLSVFYIAFNYANYKTGIFRLLVSLSLIISIYSIIQASVYSGKKTTENIKIQALAFSTDNDPEAEHLLLDMWPSIRNDTILDKMMKVNVFWKEDVDKMYDYLYDNYFRGYWGNFNFSIVPCRNDDSLLVASGNEYYENCFGFFDERIDKYGYQLTGTGFYFIDNQAGRPYYLGRLLFNPDSVSTNGLFIELYGDINVFQPGYSELLLDKKIRGYSALKDYSFAKYINGDIVLEHGEFAYDKEDDSYVVKDSEYLVFKSEGYKHIAYRNGNATVVISHPVLTFGNLIISLAYFFAFCFLSANIINFIMKPPRLWNLKNLNFRQKLQMAFIGILLFSFIIVGVVAAILTTGQYRERHHDNIREKMNSVYTELDNIFMNEDQLFTDWNNATNGSLNELLINLSNIFTTDINLYDLNGFLIATSRPEIFYRNLISIRMDIMALINLKDLIKSEFIQTESIGTLSYLSAYVPFYNANGKVLAYLNLPYFRMQSLLARDISNMVVAVINITLLLILVTMSFAVFISDRLTSPLAMLGKGLASVELGKKTEHLIYKDNDEIGELVKQYNRMVDELSGSAEKLANTEREYAWREMAKQIAHEIKNPLTPMKLNVQQLLKSFKDKVPGFDKKLENFAKNQIEYIETLSSIATAFSSFAKMPGSTPGMINLIEQIQTTLELFRNTKNVTFWVRWPHENQVFVHADKEHLNSIFSNLFKNGIQAIPADRKGLIKVTLEITGSKVIVTVADNGTGIPESLKPKLFTPNFTTKSSGTGLGLSIAKKYVEGINGRIWFESEENKGTAFYVELPLMYTVEKPGEIPKV